MVIMIINMIDKLIKVDNAKNNYSDDSDMMIPLYRKEQNIVYIILIMKVIMISVIMTTLMVMIM